jgi:hypothetical protein
MPGAAVDVSQRKGGLVVRGEFQAHAERTYAKGDEMVTASTVAVVEGVDLYQVEFRTLAAALAFFGGSFPERGDHVEVPVRTSAYAGNQSVAVRLRAA